MRKFTLVAALAAMTSPAFAGSLADPVVAPEIIATDVAGSSSGTAVVGLLATMFMLMALDRR